MPYAQAGKWRARWLDATGKLHSKNFDDHRSAAAHENRMKTEADDVRRGLRSPAPPRRTLNQLCDEWLTTRAKRKRSEADDISVVQRRLFMAMLNFAHDVGCLARPANQEAALRGRIVNRPPRGDTNHVSSAFLGRCERGCGARLAISRCPSRCTRPPSGSRSRRR